MIMRPGEPLLLPVKPLFIAATLLVAMLGYDDDQYGPLQGVLHGSPICWLWCWCFWAYTSLCAWGWGWRLCLAWRLMCTKELLLGQYATGLHPAYFLAITIHRRLLWF